MNQEMVAGIRQEARLATLMEQAELMEMPEEDFLCLVRELEQSPLFRRLYQRERVVRRERFPGTDISRRAFELEAVDLPATGTLDVETLLSTREDLLAVIRKLGLEKFKRYFIYPDADLSCEEIARACGLSQAEVERLNRFIDDFSVAAEFYHPSTLVEQAVRYTKVAAIEQTPDGLVIGYYSPGHARGRYVIDYEKLERLKESGAFSTAELAELNRLLRKLEMINRRRDALFRVLEAVINYQRPYLETGDTRALLPLTQKEVALRLGLAPSTVSRCLVGRSVDTPWGEKPLKEFFPRPRRFRRELVATLMAAENKPLSDEMLRRRLKERFGVTISRRSVADLRRELGIPSVWQRRRAGGGV